MQALALPAPYGYKEGFHISLRARDEGFNPDGARKAIIAYSCPPKIADKAIGCLCASRRYDCVVSPSWFKYEGAELRSKLGKQGVDVELLGRPDLDDPWLRQNRSHRFDGRTATSKGRYLAQPENLPRKTDPYRDLLDYPGLKRYLALD